MNLKLKTLILFVCSLIITMVPASAVQTGDIIANTNDIQNNQNNIEEDNKKISESSDNLKYHIKIIQDTVDKMNNVKWFQFWKWWFFCVTGPAKLKSEGETVESLSQNINKTASNAIQNANQVTSNGENGIAIALNSENQNNSSDTGTDIYNTGDAKANAELIAGNLSIHFNSKYIVSAPDKLVKGDIVQHYLDHNNFVYLQYVGMNPTNDTALFLGDKNTAVRLSVNDMGIKYKITAQTTTTNTAETLNSTAQFVGTNISSINNVTETTSPQLSYIASIQNEGLKNYNDTQTADYNKKISNERELEGTGNILVSAGKLIKKVADHLVQTMVFTVILAVAFYGLSAFTSGGAAVIGFLFTSISTALGYTNYHLNLLSKDLSYIGDAIQNTANININKLTGDKSKSINECNSIRNDLNTYYDGKTDNLPVSQDAVIDAEENENNTGTLNATDADGDEIIYTMDHQASNGTVTINQNGIYTYASNKNFTGNDSFTYKTNDIYGDSNIATVKINVHQVNHAPISNNSTFDIEINNNLTAELKATDADGDPITYNLLNNTYSITLNPNGTFSYTPADGFIGNDTFTYTVKDWKETGNNATVQINVHPVNHAPVANDNNITMNKNENIIGNLTATDEDGDPISYNLKDKPDHGKLDLNSDGSFSYTPKQGFIGNETFTYTAKDWKNTSNIGTVKIEVNDVNHAPIVENMNLTTTINKAIVGQFQATDLDGEKQTFKVVKTTSHGTLKINGTKFTYTPDNNFNGTDSFSYQSNDGKINSNTANIIIKVTKTPIKVINTPQTPTKTPTSTYQTTAKTAKYTPTNTLSPLSQINTPTQPEKIANQNNTNMTVPQTPDMLTPLENTPLQFIVPIVQKAANYIKSILKI